MCQMYQINVHPTLQLQESFKIIYAELKVCFSYLINKAFISKKNNVAVNHLHVMSYAKKWYFVRVKK